MPALSRIFGEIARREVDRRPPRQLQAEAGAVAVRRHEQHQDVLVFVHDLGDRAHRGRDVVAGRKRRGFHGVGAIDQPHHPPLDRQHLGERRERAVELLDEHVLVGPARDTDGVEIGDALALRCKPADRRFQQRALLRIRQFLFLRLGFFFGFRLALCLMASQWFAAGATLQSARTPSNCEPTISSAQPAPAMAPASQPRVHTRSRHTAILLIRFVPDGNSK